MIKADIKMENEIKINKQLNVSKYVNLPIVILGIITLSGIIYFVSKSKRDKSWIYHIIYFYLK